MNKEKKPVVLQKKLTHIRLARLARECAKLDPVEEKAMAEEGLSKDGKTWPEY
jgi:hypothetical protein